MDKDAKLPIIIIATGAMSRSSQMQAQMKRNDKELAHLGVPWEKTYGYAQAVRVGNTIYVAGQLSHDDDSNSSVLQLVTVQGARRTRRTWR